MVYIRTLCAALNLNETKGSITHGTFWRTHLKTYLLALCTGLLLPLASAAQHGQANPDEPEDSVDAGNHVVAEDTWSVASPDFSVEAQTITIDTDQGTWMSLDVHPDGSKIVFDLLGDLYEVPIEGGDAVNLSEGFQWDMQPRYSPDGSQIAFTSDRDGGDNIWVMHADGSEPRQITDEAFRLVNNPSWSPDGQYLAARKHYTTQRSLGAGEIWLYHLKGGKGVQLVKRPGPKYQKELGEPVYAPDGGAIYYSQNVTPGDAFTYAQDTNKEVFRIRKYLLGEGEIRNVAGGPGGAVTPTPSPDGRYLVFVRRVRANSRLFVKDLESGAERMLVDELDQDMQETWGVHGMYPNMAFTPDSKAVVFWRAGGLYRVDIENSQISQIPFRVKDTRTVYAAPRPVVNVAPEQFTTRLPRWAQRIPGKDSVIFESLGRLYVKTGAAEPRRLTGSQEKVQELFPAISRDGKWIYYVEWNDQHLGRVMRVASRGGNSRALKLPPGHYRELVVSPNGDNLVFRHGSGGYLLSDERGLEPGIYQVPVKGGEPDLISRKGSTPQFADSNDRLYLIVDNGKAEEGGRAPKKLISMNLDGGHQRDVAGVRYPTAIQISPDGSHVAFVENYHAYVVPIPATGKLISLGAESNSLPLRRITTVGASFLHWDSPERISWSVGPTYKSVEVDRIHEEDFKGVEDGLDLSLRVTADQPSGVIALTGARVVTMDGDEVLERGTIVIDGNRISAVGEEVEIPVGAQQLDLSGYTIVPGFIDAHAHGPYTQELIVPQRNWSAQGHLALGVTTVHDPSSQAVSVFAAAEYARAGIVVAPRTYSTAEIVYGAKSVNWAPVGSLDDALAHVRRLKAQGAISVKNYNQPRRAQRQQVTEAARREGVMVVAEGGALYHMDMNMVADGNTGIEHTLPQQAIYLDVIQFWGQTNVGYTPTLGVGYGGLEGEKYWYQEDDVWRHPLISEYVPPKLLQGRAVRRLTAPLEDYAHEENAAIARRLADAGVLVSTGAHGQREGLALHWEMWMLEQGGMTPMEALRAATISPATYLGLDRDLGSIVPGKLADLVVIDGDVTSDIRVSDRVEYVMANGRLYESATLSEILSGDSTPEPFYWKNRPESQIR
jgi:imidazolonepropionase-like amidohydrolase/Tol biopolymer transport system component